MAQTGIKEFLQFMLQGTGKEALEVFGRVLLDSLQL